MRTIQTKILSLIIACVIVTTTVVAIISVTKANAIIQQDSAQYMNEVSNEKMMIINQELERVEQSVTAIYDFCVDDSAHAEMMQEDHLSWERHGKIRQAISAEAQLSEWCVSAYLLPNVRISGEGKGAVYINRGNGKKEWLDVTNAKAYQQYDNKFVGRYRKASNRTEGIWLQPFYDEQSKKNVISYVIPFVQNGTCYGVVGMDVDMKMFENYINQIHIYESGIACVVNKDGTIAYHPDIPKTSEIDEVAERMQPVFEEVLSNKGELKLYKEGGTKRYAIQKKLRNGMGLIMYVPKDEVDHQEYVMIKEIILSIIASLLIAVGLSIFLAKIITRPIQHLADISKKMVEGKLEDRIVIHTQDEIGVLSENMNRMSEILAEKTEYAERLVSMDAMTGVKNQGAYEMQITELDKSIKAGEAAFGVISVDIIGLANINETYGHDIGDLMIQDAAYMMKKIFGDDVVYRLNGDTFVAILTTTELMQYHRMSQLFMREVDQFNQTNERYEARLRVAKGVSVYEKRRDMTYGEVYRRAENLMLQNKKWVKGQQ